MPICGEQYDRSGNNANPINTVAATIVIACGNSTRLSRSTGQPREKFISLGHRILTEIKERRELGNELRKVKGCCRREDGGVSGATAFICRDGEAIRIRMGIDIATHKSLGFGTLMGDSVFSPGYYPSQRVAINAFIPWLPGAHPPVFHSYGGPRGH
jgi:hypothetical protein